MTLTPGDDLNETSRQRTRDQFGLLREAHGTAIIVDTDDPADFNFICSSEHVLLEAAPGADPDSDPTIAVNRLRQWFSDRPDRQFGSVPDPPPRSGRPGADASRCPRASSRLPTARTCSPPWPRSTQTRSSGPGSPRPTTSCTSAARGRSARPPSRRRPGSRRSVAATADADPKRVRASVWSSSTPATTPRRTPSAAGAALAVAGWAASPATPSRTASVTRRVDLRAYAGHGTFVAGVIRAMAPKCTVNVLNLLVDPRCRGRSVRVATWWHDLDDALDDAGELAAPDQLVRRLPTRLDLPSRAFEDWRKDLERSTPDPTWSSSPLPATTPARGGSGRLLRLGHGRRVARPRRPRCRTSPTGATRSTCSRWAATW